MDWMQVIERIGIPLGILAAFAWGAWKALCWVGEEVVKPIVARTVKFLDQMEETTERMSDSIRIMSDHTSEHLRLQREETTKLESIHAETAEQTRVLRAHHEWAERAIANAKITPSNPGS